MGLGVTPAAAPETAAAAAPASNAAAISARQKVDAIIEKLHDHILTFATTYELSMFYLASCNLETGQQGITVPHTVIYHVAKALKSRYGVGSL
jgi:hypothetical protein